jgi:sugar phosphate isomerase/epimerase
LILSGPRSAWRSTSITHGGIPIFTPASPAPGRAKRLIAYHVCDWLVPTKDMLNDRGMMGDGVVDLRGIRQAVEDAGYTGLIEAEIFSDYWWSQPMGRVLSTCVERYRTVV